MRYIKILKIAAALAVLVSLVTAGCTPTDGTAEDAAFLAGKASPTSVMKSGGGIYAGQADANFIEIQTGSLTDEDPYEIFMLSDKVKPGFAALGLKTGDDVEFDYYINDNQQKVITAISKK